MPRKPSEIKAGSNPALDAALSYLAAGLAVVPVKRDGSKAPALPSWEQYQEAPPTLADLRSWFDCPEPPGIGVLGGRVSGGLEQIDFDHGAETAFPEWCALVEGERPGLVARLSVVRTPRDPEGYHVRYRCPEATIPGNTKLAEESYDDPKGKRKRRCLVETRGEGGYALAPGSPAECHENRRPYLHHGGPAVAQVQAISAAEREVLIRCAASFNRVVEEAPPAKGRGPGELRAGDDYNARGPDWSEVLDGWRCVRTAGAKRYWARPDKARGWSATTGVCFNPDGRELLAVFSSNADPFPGPSGGRQCSVHTKFGAYALLQHAGDFSAAAKALAALGFGQPANGQAHRHNGKAAGGGAASPLHLATTRLDTIRPQPVRWQVPRYLPRGKLVLLAGDGEEGKSSITLHLAARLSKGECAFGLSYDDPLEGETLLIQCEDDAADTVVPRLLAAGADLSRIHHLDGVRGPDGKVRPFCLAHYEALEQMLEEHPQIRFVIIDPAGAYVSSSGVDDHKDSELRALLGPLAQLSAHHQVTTLLNKHLNKGATDKAVHKVSGSVGYVNTVRAAFMVVADREDKDRKLLLPLKFNLARKPPGLVYRLESLPEDEREAILSSYAGHLKGRDREALGEQLFTVRWEGEAGADVTADSVFAAARREQDPTKAERCKDLLRGFLRPHAYPSEEILAAAKEAGFTFDNLKEAKAALKGEGLRSTNKGAFGGVWWCGFGEPDAWTRRPAPQTPHNPHNAETQQEKAPAPPIVGIVGSLGSDSGATYYAPGAEGLTTPFD